jgi:hypothetical protein
MMGQFRQGDLQDGDRSRQSSDFRVEVAAPAVANPLASATIGWRFVSIAA